jgi:hypothetical protein
MFEAKGLCSGLEGHASGLRVTAEVCAHASHYPSDFGQGMSFGQLLRDGGVPRTEGSRNRRTEGRGTEQRNDRRSGGLRIENQEGGEGVFASEHGRKENRPKWGVQ